MNFRKGLYSAKLENRPFWLSKGYYVPKWPGFRPFPSEGIFWLTFMKYKVLFPITMKLQI